MIKVQLYIDTAHTCLQVKDKLFYICNKSIKKQISPRRVDSIAITSDVQLNVSAIKLAAQNDIPIFIYNNMGKLIAQMRSPHFLKHSELRYKQLLFMNGASGIRWIKEQMQLKTASQCQTLKRLARQYPAQKDVLHAGIEMILKTAKQIETIDGQSVGFADSLMGIEGSIAKIYFKALNRVLPEPYKFERRTRRPAQDYFNALLNYMYGITYGEVSRALHAAGLDTYTGVLHKTAYKETLVFDFIECFRPIIDRLLLDSCLNKTWKYNHFSSTKEGILLTKSGKKILLPMYSSYMQQKIEWLGKVSTIRNHMHLHARRLQMQINHINENVSYIL